MSDDENPIQEAFFFATDNRVAKVNISAEARSIIRDFLTRVDETKTVAEVKAELEENWL